MFVSNKLAILTSPKPYSGISGLLGALCKREFIAYLTYHSYYKKTPGKVFYSLSKTGLLNSEETTKRDVWYWKRCLTLNSYKSCSFWQNSFNCSNEQNFQTLHSNNSSLLPMCFLKREIKEFKQFLPILRFLHYFPAQNPYKTADRFLRIRSGCSAKTRSIPWNCQSYPQ